MPPVNGPTKGSAPPLPPIPSEERQDYLTDKNLVGDARWSDSAFRRQHMKLYFALGSLQEYMAGNITAEKFHEKLDGWLKSPEFFAAEHQSFYESVLKNIHRTLDKFQTPENKQRVAAIRSMIPGRPEPKKPAPPKPEPEPVSSPFDKDNYKFNAISLDFHALDENLRGLPHYLTAGIIPEEGQGQNLSSKFGFNLNAEFSFKSSQGVYYNNFFGVYNEDLTPRNGDATFNRTGLRIGLTQRGGIQLGTPGPGNKWHLSLGGRERVGIEFGVAWCSNVANSEVSGAECSFLSPQIALIGGSQLISGGYGPFEVGLSFLESKTFVNSNSLGIPNQNTNPFVWSMAYNFNEAKGPTVNPKPEDIVRDTITNPEILMTSLILFKQGFSGNFSRQREVAFQLSRTLGSGSIYNQTKLGTFALGITNGRSDGALAFRMGKDLARASWDEKFGLGLVPQKSVIPIVMGLEFLTNVIGMAATPGTPGTVETFPGDVPPSDFDPSSNEGISDLQGRAFRLAIPQLIIRDGLAVMGAFEPFGSRNEAIKKGGMFNLYTGGHGALVLGGALLILFSGDGSGSGPLRFSILGNQAPLPGEEIDLNNSRLSLSNQAFQYHRLSAGAQLVGYGTGALWDYFWNRYKYLDAKDKNGEYQLGLKGSGGQANGPVSGSSLGLQITPDGANLSLSGTF